MPEDINANTPTAAAISLKLSEFYVNNPRFWFHLAENQFVIRNITQDGTKYAHVVASLNQEVAVRVMTILENPPATDKYEYIKQALLKVFTPSKSECAAMLLDLPGLGDRKPSQLLTHILTLLPDKERAEPGIVIREIFLRQLPPDVRAHITDKEELSLHDLSLEADRFFTNSGQRISAVRFSAPVPGYGSARGQPRPLMSQHQATSTHPSTSQPARKYCYFHERFGDQARRCRAPCSYHPGN